MLLELLPLPELLLLELELPPLDPVVTLLRAPPPALELLLLLEPPPLLSHHTLVLLDRPSALFSVRSRLTPFGQSASPLDVALPPPVLVSTLPPPAVTLPEVPPPLVRPSTLPPGPT